LSKTLKYANSLGAELVLTNSAPFLLQKFSENGKVNIYNSKGVSQNGKTYIGNTLDISDKTMEIAVIANSEAELISYKNKINKVFNPALGEGWLIYEDDVKVIKTKCIVTSLPYFSPINIISNKCLISLTANNPFWTDILEFKEEIALWKGDFEFELELVEDGIEMGHREPSLIVNVNNGGDVGCGMRVEFKALASLTNPSILNIDTQEFIKINKSMVAGETISLSTYFGNKKVESILNGVTTNAFNYIDFQSTFLQLNVGDNLFRYDSDTGIDNLEVSIYYQPQYLGV
jgi:hypothetical protein